MLHILAAAELMLNASIAGVGLFTLKSPLLITSGISRMSRLFSPSPFPLPLGEDQALGAWTSEAALFLAWHMFR